MRDMCQRGSLKVSPPRPSQKILIFLLGDFFKFRRSAADSDFSLTASWYMGKKSIWPLKILLVPKNRASWTTWPLKLKGEFRTLLRNYTNGSVTWVTESHVVSFSLEISKTRVMIFSNTMFLRSLLTDIAHRRIRCKTSSVFETGLWVSGVMWPIKTEF